MMTPTGFVEFIRRTTRTTISEHPGVLRLHGAFVDGEACAEWRALPAALPPFIAGSVIRYAGTDAAIDDDEADFAGNVFDIIVTKNVCANELRFFFESAIVDVIESSCDVDHIRIADLDPQGTFSTCRSRFALWDLEPPHDFAVREALPDPRSYTKDFTGAGLVASDLRPWMVRSLPAREGAAFCAWRLASCRRLLAATCDQVSGTPDRPAYHFSGPPTRVAKLTAAALPSLFERLQSGAAWSFGAAKDADTRHLLLASEWARTWQADAPTRFGENSLGSAKSAYAAYVKSGSKETLKALTDLRKAVAEETQKISQRASDLAGAIWKDLAIAGVPFLVKILPDSTKTSFPYAIPVVAVIAAVFLIFSYVVQVWINGQFFNRQESSRQPWKEALGGALSADEIAGISDRPIAGSIKDYGRVRTAVGIVYVLLVFFLLAFALENFEHPLPQNHS